MARIEKFLDQDKLDQEIENLGLKEKLFLSNKIIFSVKNDKNETVAILVFIKNSVKKMSLVFLINPLKYPEIEAELSEAAKKASEALFLENPELVKITGTISAGSSLKNILLNAGYDIEENLIRLGIKRPERKIVLPVKPEIKKAETPMPEKSLPGSMSSLLEIARGIQPEPLKINGAQAEPETKTTEIAVPEKLPPKQETLQVKTEFPTHPKKEIIVEIKHPNDRNAKNDLTKKEERFFNLNKPQIENLLQEIFKSIRFDRLYSNPLEIKLTDLFKIYDIRKEENERKKKRLMIIVGKKLNRGADYGMGQKQVEKIILSENSMQIFFEQYESQKTPPKTTGEKTIPEILTAPVIAINPPEKEEKTIESRIEKIGTKEKLSSVQKTILKMASLGGLKTSDLRRIKAGKEDIAELLNKNLVILKNNRYELNLPENPSGSLGKGENN